MAHPANNNILKVLRLTREMMMLADQGDTSREDNGCGVLFGALRDAAYQLRAMAEKERESHIQCGKWDCE